MDFLNAYRPVVDLFLLHSGFALSQYIVLRAGVFSLATVGFAAIGAYVAAVLGTRYGVHPALAVVMASVAGLAAGLILSWPLARLRGVYQAIATLAFVQVVLSLNLYFENVTGGAMGLSGIPKRVGTLTLLLCLALVIYLVLMLNRSRIGRALEAMRQDEAVAIALGVKVSFYQTLVFALSGAIAGLFGGLEAYHVYALDPNQFGFALLIAVLSYVVFGGRRSVIGPIVGVALLIILPELARPLAENRLIAYGVLLMLVIAFFPKGVTDTLLDSIRVRRAAKKTETQALARRQS